MLFGGVRGRARRVSSPHGSHSSWKSIRVSTAEPRRLHGSPQRGFCAFPQDGAGQRVLGAAPTPCSSTGLSAAPLPASLQSGHPVPWQPPSPAPVSQPLAPVPAPLELCHPGWLQPWPSPGRELTPTTPPPRVWKVAVHPAGWCGVNPHIQGTCCRSGYKMENTGIMCRNGRSLMGLSWQVVCSKSSRCLGCPVPGTGWGWMGGTAVGWAALLWRDHSSSSSALPGVSRQGEGNVSQSLGSARHLVPWRRGSRINSRGRKPANPISAHALGCQTRDEWARSPLELLGNGFVLRKARACSDGSAQSHPRFSFLVRPMPIYAWLWSVSACGT